MPPEWFLVAVWLAVCWGAPQRAPQASTAGADSLADQREKHDELVHYQNDYYGPGLYKFKYILDESSRFEESELRNEGRADEHIVVRGTFTFKIPNSNRYVTVKYVADDQGYHPKIKIKGTFESGFIVSPDLQGFHMMCTLCGK